MITSKVKKDLKKYAKIIFFDFTSIFLISFRFENYLSLLCILFLIIYNRRILLKAREVSYDEYSHTGAAIVFMFILFIIVTVIKYFMNLNKL